MEIIDNSTTEEKKEEITSDKKEYVESRFVPSACTANFSKEKYSCMEPTSCLHIGDNAPFFEAPTTLGYCRLTDFKGRWLCLFSHPSDFTPICSTEFMAFAKMEPEFKRRNCSLLGLSVDNINSHIAWIHSLNKMTGCPINFPLIADPMGKIAKAYGMLKPNSGDTQTVRCVFIICPEQKIRAILTYPATIGRNISEILRIIDALQFVDNEKLYTPANWYPGMPAVLPAPNSYQEVVERMQNPCDMTCYDFYLCYKQPKNITMQSYENIPLQMPYKPKECMDNMYNNCPNINC